MIRLTQTTSLQQKMAPQLIQSLRLLQMPTLELELMIQQELEINPLLEMAEEQEMDSEDEPSSEDEADESDDGDDESEEADDLENLDELEFEETDLSGDEFDEQDWSEFLEDAGYAPREERDPNVEEWEDTGAIQASLEDSLHDQLHLSELPSEDLPIAEFIIGNIDEDGFFKSTVDDVADTLGVEPDDVERVLQVIQTLEPPGVGSRDLRECLLVQLRQLEELESGEMVIAIVRDHLDDLINRRYSKICRALSVDKEVISHTYDVIATLNPKPGFTPEPRVNPNLVVPDLEVQKVGEEWVVSLTDRNAPSIRVNPLYRTLLNQSAKAGREAKKFVVDRLNSARWFISAIHQRRTTMVKVMRCIVENQIDFFEHGVGNLRPMVLQEVADKVGMHVSTISRVSNGKYVQTLHGVFELKYFFDGGLSRDDGDDISAKSVKEKISNMIHEEPAQNPLSDQKIADLLKEEGIDIARRTVAKYRDQLKINPARYRKAI